MWEEAPRTAVFGIEIYSFGLYCMIGAAAALAAMALLGRFGGLKKGTVAVFSFLCVFLGLIGSRLTYCLLNTMITGKLSIQEWFRISWGGWSLFGMIGGVLAGARISERVTGESKGELLDCACCAMPLMIAAERFGERLFEGFDVSRPLRNGAFPENTFLAVKDPYYENVSFLATYLVAGTAAILLFLFLAHQLIYRNRQDGEVFILFLILCGAGGVVLESLRYDNYLEIKFVCFQQVMAALMLSWGVILACIRNRGKQKRMIRTASAALPLAIGVCIGIEFALDRTSISHYLLYAVMLMILAVPVSLGILLNGSHEKGKGTV